MEPPQPPPIAPPPSRGQGAPSGLVGAAAQGGDVVARVVPVAPGQVLSATVVAMHEGLAWLGHRGALFSARVDAALEPGETYEFTVARTSPVVELALRTAAQGPAAEPWPGPSADLLDTLLAHLGRSRTPRAAPAGAGQAAFAAAASAFARGEVSGPALRELVRGLGHDLEARVLRLVDAPRDAALPEATQLRGTWKAGALQVLADAAANGERAPQADSALVRSLSGFERDNARRAELGLPLWLPLPSCPAVGLEDARWFAVHDRDGGAEHAGAEEPALTIVLLLEFTRLGALRVDVALRDDEVDVSMTAERTSTAAMLLDRAESLRGELTKGGIVTRSIRVQRAPNSQLPVRDLALPPIDGTSLVDCRA